MPKKEVLFTKKFRNVLAATALTTAFTFSMGAGQAFADENEVQVDPAAGDTVQQETTDSVTDSTVTDETTDPADQEEATEETATDEPAESTDEAVTEETPVDENTEAPQEEEESPSLVPGDFFYFVKVMTEKVRLAFTFDDYEEAQLLADFAAERIKEANVLLAEGKTE